MTQELLMMRCIELAQKAKGLTAPNPMVGALLLRNGAIIGEGWHRQYGADHAEVDCLKSVPHSEKHLIPGSTMYVNLEPCAHYGKTPPCADRLVQEKISKVVISNPDPFERVNGNGIEILKKGGVYVQLGPLGKEGLWLNRRFFCFHTQQRPYIILKWAQTLDGYIAPDDKGPFQITNEHSLQLTHKWRTEEAAIMVGATTALNDNPALTARLWNGRQPLRIAINRKLDMPATHQLLNNKVPTWILNDYPDEVRGDTRYIKMNFDGTFLDQLMFILFQQNILSMIVEGGAQLLYTFINAGLWDEARIFTGKVSLGSGLAAPLLKHAFPILKTSLGGDTLNVFVHKKSKYQYVSGMEL